jgi:hypothetical protein
MAVLRIQGFSGSIPVTGDRVIDDAYAVESVNTWLYGQELRGVRSPALIQTINTGTRKVFRVPRRTVGGDPDYPNVVPPPSYLGDSTWVQFSDHDTDVVKGQLVEDKFERYYFCSPSVGPRFNTYKRLKAGLSHYKLGVPGPNVDVDAAGYNAWRPTIISVNEGTTTPVVGTNIFEIEFKLGAAGAVTSYANPGGMGNRTALITITGTALFAWAGTNSIANATHLVNGDTIETGFTFTNVKQKNRDMIFDFGSAKVVDEFRWLQADSATYGDYIWQGSTDNITWVDIGAALTLGGNPSVTYTRPNGTAYRYYRMFNLTDAPAPYVTCAYVYTWVNEFGEESMPSLPVVGSGSSSGVWKIGNIRDPSPNPPTIDHPLYSKKYLYRTLSGGTNDFYRVAEIPLGTTTYNDDHFVMTDVVLTNKLPLESTFWQPPPDTLQGWIAMPNGFLIAFDKPIPDDDTVPNSVMGNNIYMCEPYHFHAWPPQYKYATENTIVGLGVIGQTCVVCTNGYPTTISGLKPASCSFTKANAGEPCLSRGGIVSTPEGVIYPSQNGLNLVGPNGIMNVTEKLITRDEWLKDYIPQYLKAVRYQNGYLALRMYPPGSAPIRSGFFLDPSDSSLRVALTELSDFDSVVAVHSDFWSGEILLLKAGEVYQWDQPPKAGFAPGAPTYMPVRWKSKEFQFPYEENFGAYAIYWDELRYSAAAWGSSILPIGTRVQLSVWANRVLRYQQTVPLNGRAVRLPSGFKADIWQFEIRARAPVYSLHVASTVKELKAV